MKMTVNFLSGSAELLTENDLFNAAREVVPLMDAFEMYPSVKAIVDECARGLDEEGYAFNHVELSKLIFDELWWQAFDRHEAPWFSKGIREELKARGCPVTVESSLDDAFYGRELDIHGLIAEHGLKKAPAYLERLWGPDRGYFFAADRYPEAVIASWMRLGIVDTKGNLLPINRKEYAHV